MQCTIAFISLLPFICQTQAFIVAPLWQRRGHLFFSQIEHEGKQSTTADRLKKSILDLGARTSRGFTASSSDRTKAKQILRELQRCNPTVNPASSYSATPPTTGTPRIAGNWTLVYTDAPDITSLGSPLLTVGRIGQECTPPYIKNVIEWTCPNWAMPLLGTTNSRVIQQVITKATAPTTTQEVSSLQLTLIGFNVYSPKNSTDGFVAKWFQNNPIQLDTLSVFFGSCKVLYLDDTFRVIQTGQGYFAVNTRQHESPWWI